MKGVFIESYGSPKVLKYAEVEQPAIANNQLLVKVLASSVNPIDWKLRKGMLKVLSGNKFPIALGFDISGEVVAVGEKVSTFKTGDSVYGMVAFPGGAYAEYAVLEERSLALKPDNTTYEEAAAIPLAAMTALQSLRNLGKIQKGQKVLINGASGGVGSFAVQIAKVFGAEVTAVCSTKNLEFVKSLGADRTIDYTKQDFTDFRATSKMAGGDSRPPQALIKYDIVFDAVASSTFSRCKNILRPQGIYVTTLPSPGAILDIFLTNFWAGKKAKLIVLKANGEDLAYLKELSEAGKLKAIIDKTYPLAEVAAAHEYSELGRTVGKIAIAI